MRCVQVEEVLRVLSNHFNCVAFVSASLLLLSGCGGSGVAPSNPVTSSITTTYLYSAETNQPNTINRFAASANGAATPNLTIALPTNSIINSMTTDSAGSLYVCVSNGPQEIIVYPQSSTSPLRTVATLETGPTAVDNSGNIYLVGSATRTVYVYGPSATDTPTRSFTLSGLSSDTGITDAALDSVGNLYIVGYSQTTQTSSIYEFNSASSNTANPTRTIPLTGDGLGIAVDTAGNIYTTNMVSSPSAISTVLEVFGTSSSTTPIRTVTPLSNTISLLYAPRVDSAGYIYMLGFTGDSRNAGVLTPSLLTVAPSQSGAVAPRTEITSSALASASTIFAIH
jgi:hypothetical protein